MKNIYGHLKQQLQGLLPATGKTSSLIDGLELIRRDRAARNESCIYQPAIEFIVQGEMESLTGNERLAYGEGQIMVTGINAPCIINDIKVAADAPFLCVDLVLDLALVTEISVNMGTINPCNSHKGICVIPSTPEIADAFLRLIRLLHTPQHIEVLAPLIIREIHYYLLIGEMGEYLRALATEGSHNQRVAKSVSWLRDNFLAPLEIEQLANLAHMSVSTFHRHFRKVTSFSPLQFQKRLRLYEAQRLMLVEELDGTTAAFQVGYESASQFNREYKREFGNPPQRDVDRMRVASV